MEKIDNEELVVIIGHRRSQGGAKGAMATP